MVDTADLGFAAREREGSSPSGGKSNKVFGCVAEWTKAVAC
jgi:hypothetical protein